MANIKFYGGEDIPLELHKATVVQKLHLLPVNERLAAIQRAADNLYLLKSDEIFLDMLTDSGVNAMSDNQMAAMQNVVDSYAGSRTYYEMTEAAREIFGMDYFLPAHQGRACENILSQALVKEGDIIPMNYHFTTTKAHIEQNGGKVVECLADEGMITESDNPFKGNFDLKKLQKVIDEVGSERIPYVRIEAGTNLIGGQPISLENIREVSKLCKKNNILVMMDASLLQDNLYFNKTREESCKDLTIREITAQISSELDIIYYSARKFGFARGGGICIRDEKLWDSMKDMITLYEGFLTYGGMSTREMGAIRVGLQESMDFDVISQGPLFIEYMVGQLKERGVPVVTPSGGLGCHVDAGKFVPNIPGEQYPAAALSAAVYIAGGIRTMERGTMSESRNEDGSEKIAEMELVRFAVPRRVFTLSQIKYAVDRVTWLYENRDIIEGIRFIEEPKTLRFFTGKLEPVSDWEEKLAKKFAQDFGDSL